MLHACDQRFDVTVTMQNFLALFGHLRPCLDGPSQERLNGLAILCIKKRLLDEMDINTIINDFASRNVIRNF
jgi:hypothetical protein